MAPSPLSWGRLCPHRHAEQPPARAVGPLASSLVPNAPCEQGFSCGEMRWSGPGVPPCRVPWDMAGDGHPVPDGDFLMICGAAPGSGGKNGRGGEQHWEQSPITLHPWHRARPCHPQIPACPCIPDRASTIPTRPAHVPTHHVPPSDDSGGGIFFFSVVVFFEQSQNICIPMGMALGHRAQDAALGSQGERGHPARWGGSLVAPGRWQLQPPTWSLLFIHRHVCARRPGPSSLPNNWIEVKKS